MDIKSSRIFTLLLCIISSVIVGQNRIINDLDTNYFIAEKDNKFGVTKDTNNINYEYDTVIVSKYYEYLFVKKNLKWGLVNMITDNVISCNYDEIFVACCYKDIDDGEDYFIVKQNNNYGVVNYKGEITIPIIYDGITSWIEYGPRAHYVLKENKIGLVDHGGNIMIPVKYDSLYFKCSEIIKAKIKGKFGVLNSNNEIIIPFKYDALIVDFNIWGWEDENHQDKFVVKRNNEWKYIDYQGKLIKGGISQQEIEKEYATFLLNNSDFKYIGTGLYK